MSNVDSADRDGVPRSKNPGGGVGKWLARAVRVLFSLAVVGVSCWVAYYWLLNQPKAERGRRRPEATLVQVNPVTAEDLRVFLGSQFASLLST